MDRLVEKRHEWRVVEEGERCVEDLWQVSVRRYQQRTGEARRLALLEYHEGQAARLSSTLGALVRYHEAEAEKYRENGHHEENGWTPNGTSSS